MNVEEWRRGTKEYIDNTILIRKLSSTRVRPGISQQEYYEELSGNFVRIREIAEQNKKILGEIVYPCLESEDLLEDELIDVMNDFVNQMIDGYDMLSIDTILVIRVVERLISDAHRKEDVAYIIHQLDAGLIVYYTAYNMLNRTGDMEKLGDEYSSRGMELGEEILSYIEKDKFAALPDDESKELVLVNSRYLTCFHETKCLNREKCDSGIEFLRWSKQITDDPFYHEHAPNYDWIYHKVRLCEYACTMTQVGNVKGLTYEQCLELYPYALMLEELVEEDIEGLTTRNMARLLSSRVKYYAKKISAREYLETMGEIYSCRRKDFYHIDDVYMNLIIPVEYLVEVQRMPEPTEEMYSNMGVLYRDIVRYISRTQNDETLGASLEYYADFLNNFVEYPGGMTFYEVVMLSMAGMHLPTYVHSNMVGKISLCMARHMLRKNPGYFVGLWGIETADEAKEKGSEIMDFIYNAGVLHDAGKLFMIDTVFVYGRKLLDEEFAIIKNHPKAGNTLLRKYPSTRAYADIAEAHHKCADNKSGYAYDFDLNAIEESCLAKIVTVADGMDAATDSVGRSYGKGITLEKFISEVAEGRGGRYDADIADLLTDDESLHKDLAFILENERQVLYYKSYDLMFRNFRED